MWDIEGAEEERRGLESAAEAEAEKDNYRENGSEDKKNGREGNEENRAGEMGEAGGEQ